MNNLDSKKSAAQNDGADKIVKLNADFLFLLSVKPSMNALEMLISLMT